MGLGSSDLMAWFRRQGWMVYKGYDKPSTHYFLDGGKGHVADPAAFHFQLAKALFHHEKIYAVEVRTPVFRFYADLDFLSGGGAALTEDYLSKALGVVQRCLSECGVRDDCLVLTAATKRMSKGGSDFVKSGVHLVWPDTYVTKEQAKLLRGRVVAALVAAIGERDPCNPWEDVYDECVYKGNGLRMVGCRKAERCRACQEAVCVARQEAEGNSADAVRRVPCTVCSDPDTGHPCRYVDKGRPYRPQRVLKPDGETTDPQELEKLGNDFLHMVQRTHIRSSRAAPTLELGFDVPEGLPISTTLKGGRQRLATSPTSSLQEMADFEGKPELLAFLKEKFSHHGAMVRSFKNVGSCITVITDSRWCHNVKRAHNGNRTYLVVRPCGVEQRCHSVKNGCAGYRSPTVPLPPELRRALFGAHDNVLLFMDSDDEDDLQESGSSEPSESSRLSMFAPHGRSSHLVSLMKMVQRPPTPPRASKSRKKNP